MPDPKSGVTSRGRAETASGIGGEFAAIERLRRRLPGPPPGEVWIGDDAAVLGPVDGVLLLTTDLAVAGVHADLALIGLDDLGWRAMAAAVSDVAAMGGSPHRAVVAVAGPPGTDLDLLYAGIGACAAAHRCPVVGGDLSGGNELVVAVAVTGRVAGASGPVLRAGARAGDSLFVTGPLGASAAGLRWLRRRRSSAPGADTEAEPDAVAVADGEAEGLMAAHRRPHARLVEGETARLAGARAMVDVSDGLLADLGHVADASGVGFRLDTVPVAAGASVDDALGGGEDYELVMATPDPGALLAAFAAAGLRTPVLMGTCTADPRQRTLGGRDVVPVGWEHPFGSPATSSRSASGPVRRQGRA
jgi:thiamine-monophosphate kinase